MAVNALSHPEVYLTDGQVLIYTVPFIIDNADQVSVVYEDVAGLITSYNLNTDYVINGNEISGYDVDFTGLAGAPAAGGKLAVLLLAKGLQPSVFRDDRRFPARSTEHALDRLALDVQSLMASKQLMLQRPATEYSETLSPLVIPTKPLRAGKILAFDGAGIIDIVSRENVDLVASLSDNIQILTADSVVAGLQALSPTDVVAGVAALRNLGTQIQILGTPDAINAVLTVAAGPVQTQLGIVEGLQVEIATIELRKSEIFNVGTDLALAESGILNVDAALKDPQSDLSLAAVRAQAAIDAQAASEAARDLSADWASKAASAGPVAHPHYSSRGYAVDDLRGDNGGSAKDWAVGAGDIDGAGAQSAKTLADGAVTSAATASTKAVEASDDAAIALSAEDLATRLVTVGTFSGANADAKAAAALVANANARVGSIFYGSDGLLYAFTSVGPATAVSVTVLSASEQASLVVIVADAADLLTRYDGASDGDIFTMGRKLWERTSADIQDLVTADSLGVLARARSGADGSTGGFLEARRIIDLADTALAISFNATGDNAAALNTIGAIAAAFNVWEAANNPANNTSGMKIICSRPGTINIASTVTFNSTRLTFDAMSNGLVFTYTGVTGDGIVFGGTRTTGPFAATKANYITVRGLRIKASNKDHTGGTGLVFRDADRILREDCHVDGFEGCFLDDNADHVIEVGCTASFGARTTAQKNIHSRIGNDDADTAGYNTTLRMSDFDYYSSDFFEGVCAHAVMYRERFDGEWQSGCHTIGGAYGLLINGKDGTDNLGHSVSMEAVNTYYDRAGVSNLLIMGEGVKSFSSRGGEYRTAGNRSVISRTITATPASPTFNDLYIVPASGVSGAWVGNENNLTAWDGAAWRYLSPLTDNHVGLKDGTVAFWNGSVWADIAENIVAGHAVQVIVNAGKVHKGIHLSGLAWQAERGALSIDDTGGTIENVTYDLTVQDCNAAAVSGQYEVDISVASGHGVSHHFGGETTGRTVQLQSSCADAFTLGICTFGGSDCTDKTVSDARAGTAQDFPYIPRLSAGQVTVGDISITPQTIAQRDESKVFVLRASESANNGAAISLYGESHGSLDGQIFQDFLGGGKWRVRKNTAGTYEDALTVNDDLSVVAAGALSGANTKTFSTTIADDAVGEIVIPAAMKAVTQPSGLLLISGFADGLAAIGTWIVGASFSSVRFPMKDTSPDYYEDGGANRTDLTTTSATDGKIKMQINATENIHINNRSGATRTLHITMFGGVS